MSGIELIDWKMKKMGTFKLVCFDLDGVLTVKDDSWSYIHHNLGVWEQAKEHRKLFFASKINYQQWADLDVGLWKNVSLDKINSIIQQIRVRPHIETVVQELKNRNLISVILSSGLSFFTDYVKNKFGFDFAIANSPIIGENNKLTGEIHVSVSYNDKDSVLQGFLTPYNIKLKDCIAIGDGENDIPLFKEVGFSIAFNPKNEFVAKAADVTVADGDLLEVLSIILSRL
ncbi:MAG: HAD-IB family phosphatase [Candidatus Helarchaeota archaeon]|nr:HAD-IB family phosphatase [Candidatus Helarchaeota archaeon]